MISRKDLKELMTLEPDPESPVLSVYLNVDQHDASNLNRGFETALKSLLRDLEQRLDEEYRQNGFTEDTRQLSEFVSEYSPRAKSIVVYSDASRGLLWNREMQISFANSAHWRPRPHIRPLLEARDEFERYGVILTDRGQARLFTVFLGEIEENREALAEADVRRFDAAGSDQLLSQMHFQRKSDEHARWHLKHVASLMERLAKEQNFDRLALAGTQEAVGELKNLLSDRLKRSIVGFLTLPIDAPESKILEETVRLEQHVERESEESLVKDLLTAAAKNQQAVTGLEATLDAVHQGRIRELVYADGYEPKGGECQKCGVFLENTHSSCPNCQGGVLNLDDLLEPVVERVFQEGGSVEQVREKAAEELKEEAGGVGAFLRF